jgi:hypothetical protein
MDRLKTVRSVRGYQKARADSLFPMRKFIVRKRLKKFEFERAAALRDRIRTLKQRDLSGFFSAASEPALVEPMADGKSSVPAPPSKSAS